MRPLLALLLAMAFSPARAERTVAVTFDDLPGAPGSVAGNDVGSLRAMTARILDACRSAGVPAIGFVNEGKLFLEGETAAQANARIGLLEMWLEAGFELGNHTYSHRSLNRLPLEEFQEDVVRGEPVTRRLLTARGRPLRYFRHPFLQVGLDLEKRRAFERFLEGRGYTVAPVTIDNDEWIYAAVYADALRRGDRAFAARVAADYLRYMGEVTEFIERVSRDLLGREIPQVLLLHANAINADHFAGVARMLKARGYRFVTLEEALADPVWERPDTYVGAWGISWLHHWEVTSGRKRTPSPDPPPFIGAAHQALPRPSEWSWERLRSLKGVEDDVAWLEASVPLEEARRLGGLAARLSRPEAAQLFPAFALLDGLAYLPDEVVKPPSKRPPPGEAGLVRVVATVLRTRLSLEAFWKARAPGTWAERFTGRALELPAGGEPANGERLSLTLDFAPARTLLDLLERGVTDRREILAALDSEAFDALVTHRSQSFYPLATTRELLAENLAHAAADGPAERLWREAHPRAFLDFGDVRAHLAEYRRLLDELEGARAPIAAHVERAILPLLPADLTFERRVAFFFCGGADGWASGGLAGIDLEYFKDDHRRLLDTLVHETFHVAQAAAFTDGETQKSPARRAAATLYNEGTATYLAAPQRLHASEVARRVEAGRELVKRILDAPAGEEAAKLADEGVRGAGPFYWLGAEMARTLVKARGEAALAATLRGGSSAFLTAYAEAARGQAGVPLSPELAQALLR